MPNGKLLTQQGPTPEGNMSENQNIEWKETWRDEYLKWICGFANAQGGVLEIGKNDRGEVVGVKNVLRLLEEIPNKAQALLGVVVDVNLKSEDGGEYLEIAVDPYPNPISYKGEFYYRSGSTKQVLRGAALSRFLLQKYGRTWDDVPLPGVGLKDLDGRVFDGFRQRGADSERLPQDILDESDEGVIEIQISVYDDRIAIWNAVQLPPEWPPINSLETFVKAYNPRIAYAFFRAGMIEAWVGHSADRGDVQRGWQPRTGVEAAI